MAVYGYTRISDIDAKVGAAKQRATVDRFFAKVLEPKGLTFSGFFQDRASDARRLLINRPEGYRLDAKLARGDTVVIARADRSFPSLRNLIDTAQQWHAIGVRLVVIDFGLDTATQAGVETLNHFDHFERWSKAMTRAWQQEDSVCDRRERVKGFWCIGGAPFGWKTTRREDGTIDLIPFEEERENYRRIMEIYAVKRTVLGTQKEARARGIVSVRGKKPYRRSVIRKMIDKGHEILADTPPKPVWSQYRKGLTEEERLKMVRELGYKRPDRYRDCKEKPDAAETDDRQVLPEQRGGDPDHSVGQGEAEDYVD